MNSFYNDVNDWLSVGGDLDLARDVTGQDFATTIASLRTHGVTHVLDVRSEYNDKTTWVQAGLPAENYHLAPIIDSRRHTPDEGWYRAVQDFVQRFWLDSAEGDRLYVHCHMGINRAPSAAMLALLAVDPTMHPYEAFLQIREARPVAGLVYAEAVGVWHLFETLGIDNFTEDDDLPAEVVDFHQMMQDYWTPELSKAVNRGIAYYRSKEGGTLKVGGQTIMRCPNDEGTPDERHRLKWGSGDPRCMDCNAPARVVVLD